MSQRKPSARWKAWASITRRRISSISSARIRGRRRSTLVSTGNGVRERSGGVPEQDGTDGNVHSHLRAGCRNANPCLVGPLHDRPQLLAHISARQDSEVLFADGKEEPDLDPQFRSVQALVRFWALAMLVFDNVDRTLPTATGDGKMVPTHPLTNPSAREPPFQAGSGATGEPDGAPLAEHQGKPGQSPGSVSLSHVGPLMQCENNAGLRLSGERTAPLACRRARPSDHWRSSTRSPAPPSSGPACVAASPIPFWPSPGKPVRFARHLKWLSSKVQRERRSIGTLTHRSLPF